MTEDSKKQGFALLTPEERSELSRRAGIVAQRSGRAHRWTSEEAREAGKKGKAASMRKRARP